ncbi:MAG: sigma-70 family RNA polymerase sigma factor [Myxococcota bacterium]
MTRKIRESYSHIDHLRRQAAKAPILDLETERELVTQLADGSHRALERLVASHMRLVLSIADRYAQRGVAFEDLVSEGAVGLMEAAKRFDPAKGTRFGTYAAWWVRAYVRRHALQNRRIVGAPSTRNARRILWGLRRTEHMLAQRLGRPASREEVAEALDVSSEEVAMVESLIGGRDLPVGPPMPDQVAYEPPDVGPTPEDNAELGQRERIGARLVQQALAKLDDREREIVRRRLLSEDPSSLAKLGESFGVSRERVRQIQERAQKKLRTAIMEQVA